MLSIYSCSYFPTWFAKTRNLSTNEETQLDFTDLFNEQQYTHKTHNSGIMIKHSNTTVSSNKA